VTGHGWLASPCLARYAARTMQRSMMLILAMLAAFSILAARPAAAADMGLSPHSVATPTPYIWRYNTPGHDALPFPRSERAQAVWDAGACWSECGAQCAWGEAGCLTRDAQGECLTLADRCDRYCQHSCRTQGGPWLPFE
jgi:hypothetical protein